MINLKITIDGKWKKGINQPLLFDAVPIENYIFSLLHAEIGVGNKIIENYFLWITERTEEMSEEEVILTNCLINFKIELKNINKFMMNGLIIIALLWLHCEWIEN